VHTTMLEQARELLQQHTFGVLSSHSQQLPGYPHSSVMPYFIDQKGDIVILISRLAQHTRNVQKDSRVSLFVMEPVQNDVQASRRLSLACDASRVTPERVEPVACVYYTHFPHCDGYHKQLDFEFYELSIRQVSFISGFARVVHYSADEWLHVNSA